MGEDKQMSSKPMLRIEGLAKNYGGLKAVRGVSFEVPEGEIVGLIGPNLSLIHI